MMMSLVPNINQAYSLLVDLESHMSLVNFTQVVQVAEVAEGNVVFSNRGPVDVEEIPGLRKISLSVSTAIAKDIEMRAVTS